MTITEKNHLSRIYNTLLMVKTQGEDTIVMGKCLESLYSFLTNASEKEEEQNLLNKEE
jgi:hypothetical protein